MTALHIFQSLHRRYDGDDERPSRHKAWCGVTYPRDDDDMTIGYALNTHNNAIKPCAACLSAVQRRVGVVIDNIK